MSFNLLCKKLVMYRIQPSLEKVMGIREANTNSLRRKLKSFSAVSYTVEPH